MPLAPMSRSHRPRGLGQTRLQRAGAIALLAAALTASPSHAQQAPFQRLDLLLTDPVLRQSHVGLDVRRLSGEVLYAHHAERLFTPASVVKLATTATALRRLGPETRFKTEVLASSEVVNGELRGDVWVKGYGDPTLRTADLDAFVDGLTELGLRRIAGDVIADASHFEGPRYPSGWMWDDLTTSFAAPVSALSLDANAALDDPLHEPPELRVAERLSERLAEIGITLAGTVRVGQAPERAEVLYQHWSPPLAEIVAQTNKASDNFLAETLVRHLGAQNASGSHAAGMTVLHQALGEVGWGSGTYRLEDGSGLSRYDAVTPRQMTDLLVAAALMPEAPSFLGSLPVASVDGTLASRMLGTRAQGVVAAKTGTMSGVSSLSGYVLRPGKEPLAFTLMINGFAGSAKPIQQFQDALLDALVEAAD